MPQNLLDTIFNSDGEIDYERVQNAVDGVISGIYQVRRLDAEGEGGRIKGSRLLIGASLIIAGETRTSRESDPRKRRNKEEDLLEEYAKSQKAWIDDIEAFRDLLAEFGKGAEAKAYEHPEVPVAVIKIAPIPYILGSDSSILRFFDDKIALHNTLPNVAPYELIGFTRDWNVSRGETFLAVLRQPYIRGEETIGLDERFLQQMQDGGFSIDHSRTKFSGKGLSVLDVTDKNVILAENGKFIIFDPMVFYINDSDYRSLELVDDADR